jgi:two-component sensor histidine kinase
LLVFDVQNKTTSCITADDPKYELMLNSTNCVYEDRSGNIWVGTSGYGLLKYNVRADRFHHTDNVSISWMHEGNNGNILIIKKGDLFWVFDKKTRNYIKKIPDAASLASSKYQSGTLEAVLQDKDGSYWMAKQRLLHYDERKKKFEYFDFNSDFFFPIHEDRDGMIWTGIDNSFCSYNKKTKQFTHYPYPVHTDNFPYRFIQAIYQQSDSIFWLGTLSGLFRFNRNTGEWKQFKNNPADTSSLSYDLVFSLCADPFRPDKYLWIGTSGGGFNRFDFATQKFLRYSTKDGLPNNVVYGILSDDAGNLWMSTNKGLSKFNISTKTFQNYEPKDGLQSNEFNRYAFCKTSDGTLFFGGVNGFNYFNPSELGSNNTLPNIIITDLKIGNKPITIHSKDNLLQKPVYLTRKIVLKYKYNMISFDFAAMDFSQPGKNLYQYKLEGFDENWIQSGTAHTATYTNLDPGTYTFHVKGSNSDGFWNETGTSVQLVILPPWYMTWWFRTLISIALIAAVYVFYHYRLQQALRMQAVRNRIASDLHDEIGSNLSNISIFSNVAQQNASNENNALLKRISEYTQVSMEAMSDIVWMINARNDRFENIFIRMRSLAAEIFEAKNCALHIELDDKFNSVKLNMEKRKNFYLIYKEAINNVAKYAACKDVWIDMQMHHNEVLLQIKDNGNGFDVAKRKSGNGLFNMQQRADMLKGKLVIASNTGEGTLVELRFEV